MKKVIITSLSLLIILLGITYINRGLEPHINRVSAQEQPPGAAESSQKSSLNQSLLDFLKSLIGLDLSDGSEESPGSGGGEGYTPASPASVQELLSNPRIQFDECARRDLVAGVVDQRLVTLLNEIGKRHSLAGVGPFKSCHRTCVGVPGYFGPPEGCSKYGASVSKHYYGQAVDLGSVDGQAVNKGTSPWQTMVSEVNATSPPLKPGLVLHPGNDANHFDHVHIQY